jgi:hypothetical protein
MHSGFVVVVVGGGFVVVVVEEGFVVVVVEEGFVVVVVVGGFVVVVVGGGFVVVVVEEGFVVVVVEEGIVGGEDVVVAFDVVEVVVGEKVDVGPGFGFAADAEDAATSVVVGAATTLRWWATCEVDTVPEATSGRTCVNASPPAAVVPSATDPATRATWEPVTTTLPRLLNWLTMGISKSQASGPITQRWRPTEMFRNALTIAGSNWVPAQRVSSLRASRGDIALL